MAARTDVMSCSGNPRGSVLTTASVCFSAFAARSSKIVRMSGLPAIAPGLAAAASVRPAARPTPRAAEPRRDADDARVHRRDLLAILPVAGFVGVIDTFQVSAEEEALRDRFGSTYGDYVASVRRWL